MIINSLIMKCNAFTIIDYQKEKLSVEEISKIIDILNIKPIDLIRKNEADFKNLNLSVSQFKNDQLIIDMIVKYPRIMQRPIIINGNKGIIGRPPENIYKIL